MLFRNFDPDAVLSSAQANTAMVGLITIKQFAAMVGLSVRQVRRLNAAGQAPERIKHGHRKKYRLSEAQAWKEAREQKGAAQ